MKVYQRALAVIFFVLPGSALYSQASQDLVWRAPKPPSDEMPDFSAIEFQNDIKKITSTDSAIAYYEYSGRDRSSQSQLPPIEQVVTIRVDKNTREITGIARHSWETIREDGKVFKKEKTDFYFPQMIPVELQDPFGGNKNKGPSEFVWTKSVDNRANSSFYANWPSDSKMKTSIVKGADGIIMTLPTGFQASSRIHYFDLDSELKNSKHDTKSSAYQGLNAPTGKGWASPSAGIENLKLKSDDTLKSAEAKDFLNQSGMKDKATTVGTINSISDNRKSVDANKEAIAWLESYNRKLGVSGPQRRLLEIEDELRRSDLSKAEVQKLLREKDDINSMIRENEELLKKESGSAAAHSDGFKAKASDSKDDAKDFYGKEDFRSYK